MRRAPASRKSGAWKHRSIPEKPPSGGFSAFPPVGGDLGRPWAGASGSDVRPPAGFGIGLSLAQALVSAQGGTLRAFNNPDGGARFEIAFPKLVV